VHDLSGTHRLATRRVTCPSFSTEVSGFHAAMTLPPLPVKCPVYAKVPNEEKVLKMANGGN